MCCGSWGRKESDMTERLNCGWLNNSDSFSLSSGGWKSKIKVLASVVYPVPFSLADRWLPTCFVLTWSFFCLCVCVCVCVCAHMCVCVCVHACVCASLVPLPLLIRTPVTLD